MTQEELKQAKRKLIKPIEIDMDKITDKKYYNDKVEELAIKADQKIELPDLLLNTAELIIARMPTEEDMEELLKEFSEKSRIMRKSIIKGDPEAFSKDSLEHRFWQAQARELIRTKKSDRQRRNEEDAYKIGIQTAIHKIKTKNHEKE